jgi:hypothetical protein
MKQVSSFWRVRELGYDNKGVIELRNDSDLYIRLGFHVNSEMMYAMGLPEWASVT